MSEPKSPAQLQAEGLLKPIDSRGARGEAADWPKFFMPVHRISRDEFRKLYECEYRPTEAYRYGYEAGASCLVLIEWNPHDPGSDDWSQWRDGFRIGRRGDDLHSEDRER